MSSLKKFFLSYSGHVPIPRPLLDRSEHILLHISDTPSNFYGGLDRLIRLVSPEYIVHTGDFVDDVKLEIRPYKLWLYEKKAAKLMKMLEASSAKEIHMVLGNHDNLDVIKRHSLRCVISEAKSLSIENRTFNISHYSHDEFEGQAPFHLFGHDLSMKSRFEDNCWHLNGISAINIIFLTSGAVLTLPYPYGTDNARQKKTKIGL